MPPKKGANYGTLGELKAEGTKRRDSIEECLTLLMDTSEDLGELALRIEQAMRRAATVSPVLMPALERIAEVRQRIERIHATLIAYWNENQSKRWA